MVAELFLHATVHRSQSTPRAGDAACSLKARVLLLASSRTLGFLPCVSRDDDDCDEDTFVGRQFLAVSPPACHAAAHPIASIGPPAQRECSVT